nr:hypothetical protein [Tanacetum cinerariifolium]
MMADSLLPIPFGAEAVNTACYVQNRVLVTKPYNKTPYELLHGRTPTIGFMRPFGCPNTDRDAAFDGKEHDFDAKKPVSEVIVSPSSSAQDLSAEFEDYSDNSINEVNAAVKQTKDGIFISQDKYVVEILRKFRLTEGKSASTPIDTEKPLLKDLDGEDVDVHTYRSMIGSLIYLTSSRPDIMFAQCKKQTVVATSSTEAEYVAASSCCAQVLWIQNQLLDNG